MTLALAFGACMPFGNQVPGALRLHPLEPRIDVHPGIGTRLLNLRWSNLRRSRAG